MKLIVGLGNPGKAYSANRHNIGFLCLNRFARQNDIVFDKKKSKSRLGFGKIAGNDVILAKPQTFMNASGSPVYSLMHIYGIRINELFVVHDDMDLPLGKIRIRCGNSAGGHNGVQSIISALDSQEFVRIRVGIGRPQSHPGGKEAQVIDYVLGDFLEDEQGLVKDVIVRVGESLVCLLTQDLDFTMNKFN